LSTPRANKVLGQHFLVDSEIIQKICNDWKDSAESIIEVGPGAGALTQTLSEIKKPFHIIEKDSRFTEVLSEWVDRKNMTIADALELDFKALIEKINFTNNLWLVSNLPYNISVPLLMRFIKTPSIKWMTLMFQQEVGDKITPVFRKKNVMGSLMAICDNFFDVTIVSKVPTTSFAPPPRVESVVLSFTRKENPQVQLHDFDGFESFLRLLYSQKRKQVGTVLKEIYPEEAISKWDEDLKITKQLRAETFNTAQIQLLYSEVKHLFPLE
jgi:16S rRNA (adenine1518-N6/adenine1519-N6)-dimethyltransferase